MGIFFGFLTIIANSKNPKQSATHKMCNPKINSHHSKSYSPNQGTQNEDMMQSMLMDYG